MCVTFLQEVRESEPLEVPVPCRNPKAAASSSPALLRYCEFRCAWTTTTWPIIGAHTNSMIRACELLAPAGSLYVPQFAAGCCRPPRFVLLLHGPQPHVVYRINRWLIASVTRVCDPKVSGGLPLLIARTTPRLAASRVGAAPCARDLFGRFPPPRAVHAKRDDGAGQAAVSDRSFLHTEEMDTTVRNRLMHRQWLAHLA
jgi:hypothetical protein